MEIRNMEELQDDLKIYSEEVRDVLSDPPKAIFKWGNTILLLFIILLALLSWYIKYPDIIRAEIIITTQQPPDKIVSKTNGRIKKLWVENQQEVEKNTELAIIENTANYETVFLLKSITDTLNFEGEKLYFPIEKFNFSELGEIENAFSVFQRDYNVYQQYKNFKPYFIEKNAQSYESRQLNERINYLKQQIQIADRELSLKKKELNRYKSLYEKGIISTQEWETREIDYLQLEKNTQNLNTQLSQLKSSVNDVKRNNQSTIVSELKDDVNLQKNAIQSFNQLKKVIADWDLTYVLRSSIKGRVSFLQVWAENQNITQGEQVFTVIPESSNEFIGKIRATALNSGKIKNNQDIIIRLANYPDREFGVLKGVISAVSLIPNNDGLLLIDAKLPNKLTTTFNKQIEFRQEMSGTADIITEDLRLIERLLFQFRDVFRR